jgi:hypothetical protein
VAKLRLGSFYAGGTQHFLHFESGLAVRVFGLAPTSKSGEYVMLPVRAVLHPTDFSEHSDIWNIGPLSVTNSPVSGNSAPSGGICSSYSTPYWLVATTLANSIVGGNTRTDGVTPSDLAGGNVVTSTGTRGVHLNIP